MVNETKSYGRRIFDSRREEFARLHANSTRYAWSSWILPPLFPNSIRFSVSSGIKSVSVSKKSGAGFGTNESSLKDSIRRFILPREGRREGGKKETREGKCIKKKKIGRKKKGTCNCV